MKGFTGKILIVNLSTGEIQSEKIPESVYEQVLSGVGLGAYVLYRHIPAGADPLGPDNMLGFVSGLLTGTPSVVTGRWMIVCKSPLTGGWGDANCGGNLSPAIKQCGYDGIFIKGAAKEPVYLYIDQRNVEIRSAAHLWGLDTIKSEEILLRENLKKKKPGIAVIGPAAEKLSLISGISNDSGRMAARSGVGAVMGSKLLKGIVLAGTRQIGCHDPAAMKTISKELAIKMRKQNAPGILKGDMLTLMGKMMGGMPKAAPMDGMMVGMMMKKWGTPMNNAMGAENGDTPIKNWAGSVVDYKRSYYKNLNPDRVLGRETKKYHCYSCIIGCGGVCDINNINGGEFSHTHKPEYETCAAFGSLLMNKDLDSIFYINELLNRAGMDSISAGNTVAFALECYEKGFLTPEMTGGLELKWGDPQAIISLVKMMIERKGIGDLLADGVKAASRKLGEAAQDCAVHAGGQEPGMHDSRMDPVLAIHYSVDPTPGRHTVGTGQYYDLMHLWTKVSWAPNPGVYNKAEEYLATDKLALKTVANSCYKEITDGSGGCLFAMTLGVQHWKLFEWLNAATGWEKTPDEYMLIGKRIQTLRQMFNIKHGIDPWKFKISKRIAGIPTLKQGPLKDKSLPIDDMMRLHWKHFGWDENSGAPLPETLVELELDELMEEEVIHA